MTAPTPLHTTATTGDAASAGADDTVSGHTGVDEMTFVAWPDPVIDRQGHDPRSGYVERFWLGVLGPSAIWWHRWVAFALDESPEGVRVALADLAAELGLGHRGGRNSPMARTIGRCCEFRTAARRGRDVVAVRRRLPPLTLGQLARLSPDRRDEHDQWQHNHPHQPDLIAEPDRVRHLAGELIALGEGLHSTARLLGRWRVPVPLARRCAAEAWAAARTHPSASRPPREPGGAAAAGEPRSPGDPQSAGYPASGA